MYKGQRELEECRNEKARVKLRGSTSDDEARDRWGQNGASLGLSVLVHLSLTPPPKCYIPR